MVFGSTNGTLGSLENCLLKPDLSKVSVGLMNLYLHLIEEFADRIKPYSSAINRHTTAVIRSSTAKAAEKEAAIRITRELIERKFLPDDELPRLLTQMYGVMVGKLTDRFAQKLYQTIGLILRNHPDQTSLTDALTFRQNMLAELEKFICGGNKISFLVAAGCLDALRYCFFNYPPDPSSEPNVIDRVYKIIHKFCHPENEDRGTCRSSLALFKTHVALFGLQVLRDAQEWHLLFVNWLKTVRADDKEFVVPAVYAFYGQIATSMTEDVNGESDCKKELLELFLAHFKESLLDAQSKPFQIRLSILSFGILSVPVKAFLPGDVVGDLVNIVIANTNYAYFSELADKRDKIEHLPDFIQALSLLIEHVDGLSSVQLSSLEKLVDALMQDFQYLSTYNHPLVVRSLVNTFNSVSKLGATTFDDFLSRVMLQGILWACSHKMPMDTYQDNEMDWKQNVTFRNYLPLWRGLMASEDSGTITKPVGTLIGDTFLRCFVEIVRKLDLGTVKRKLIDASGVETETFFCDPDSDLVPRQSSDFQIFFNLVSFYQDVLMTTSKAYRQKHLPNWFAVISQELIRKSYKFPLVSGFMKLLELFLKISYDSFGSVAEFLTGDLKRNLIEYFRAVMAKAKGSSGELQLASLQLIFKAPDEIFLELIEDMFDVFEIGFSVGRSVLWLTESALTCLERNVGRCTDGQRDLLLRKVLPLFDNFLLSKSALNTVIDGQETTTKALYRNKRCRRTLVIPPEGTGDLDLRRVQKRIILFLGTLEPDQCLYMINSDANQLNLTKWDIDRNVKLPFFCPDKGIQPELVLDKLMPRVFHLARAATDRQTKIAACELVHGITLYVIGGRKMSNRRFWLEIYTGIIALACDPDTAVQQMFEPLLVQVMHFKARPEEWSKTESGILVEVLMDCLSDPKHPAIRDMAAKALRELISWTMELSSSKHEVVRTVIKRFVQLIHFNSMDYNTEKRLGAALAFNNIYRILRENELIIDLFWIMFLSAFATSLWLCDQTEEVAFGTEKLVEQVENCLDHVTRVIVERPQILSVPNEERMKPSSIPEANLNSSIDYVFQWSCSKNLRIRKKSQEIFLKLVVLEYATTAEYFQKKFNGQDLLQTLGGRVFKVNDIDFTESLQTIEYLQCLSVALNTCCFLIAKCKIDSILKVELLRKWEIFNGISVFLDFILHKTEATRTRFTISAQHKIQSLLEAIIEDLLQFFHALSGEEVEEYITFLHAKEKQLMNLVQGICFNKKMDLFTPNMLRSLLEKWLESMRYHSWTHFFASRLLDDLKNRMLAELAKIKENLETVLQRDLISKEEESILSGVLNVQKLLLENLEILPYDFTDMKSSGHRLATILLSSCKGGFLGANSVKPTVKEYANQLMKFSLNENHNSNTLTLILDGIISQIAITQKSDKAPSSLGRLFLHIFRERIFEYLLSFHKIPLNIFGQMFAKGNSDNIEDLLNVVSDLTEYVFKCYVDDTVVRDFVSKSLVSQWNIIYPLISARENSIRLVTDIVVHIGLVTPTDPHLIGEQLVGFEKWLLGMLESNDHSPDQKCKTLCLLPVLTGQGPPQKSLLKALYAFKSKHIPHASNEVNQNSLERAKYVVMMRTLLDSFRISRSLTLLEFLISITAPDDQHIMETELRRNIFQLITSLEDKRQLDFLQTSFQFFQKRSTRPLLKLNIFRRFIKSIIKACKRDVIKSFYEFLMTGPWQSTVLGKLIEANYELQESDDPSYVEAFRDAIRDALVNRIVGFYLLELLYSTLELEEMIGIATKVQFKRNTQPEKTRNMLTNLTKTCFDHSKELKKIQFRHDPLNELFRKYKCCAYRALCTIVMSTTTDIKLYNKAIFSKDIWPQIIGTEEDIFSADFVSDFEDFPRVKERLISMKADALNINGNDHKLKPFNTVFSSSLSQDVTKIDFTSRILQTETRAVNKAIMLEDLAMNKHELMPTLCAVIQHMFQKNIMTSTSPEWVDSLFKLMYNKEVHKNIRLFVGRLVENCKELLKEYAPILFKGVLQLIVDQCSGPTLNVYCMDLVQMLIQWSVQYVPESEEEKELIVLTVKFLVQSCYDENSDVMKMNLEIIRIAVMTWKDLLNGSVSKVIPYDLLNPPDKGSVYCGLQLIAIFLTNTLSLWTQSTRNDYIQALVSQLHSECSKTYKTAAQLIGYYLDLEKAANFDVVVDYLQKELRKNEKKFVDVIYGIHLKFPDVVVSFRENIYSNIPTAIKTVRIKYLTLLLVETHPLKEIVAIGLLDMMNLQEYQVYILHVLNKSLSNFSDEECGSIVEEIIRLTKASKLESRLVAYQILCKLYERGEKCPRRSDVTYILIRGFRDTEETIQNLLLMFWSNNDNLPAELAERICKATELFADVKNIDDFLEFSTQLLLDVMIKDENSTRGLIPTETKYDNKLTEYQINVSARSQNLSHKIPLFARSLNSSFVPGQSSLTFMDNPTSNLLFEATQDMSVIRGTGTVHSIPTQSSFIFNSNNVQLLNQNSMSLSMSSKEIQNPLKKRLIRDKVKAARNIAVQAINKRCFEEQKKLYRRRDRSGKIVIYRRYRHGDFPDFLINHRALFLPLQALVKRDQITARIVYVGIFQSLVDAMDAPQKQVFCKKLQVSTNAAVKDIMHCSANVYGSFMEISFHNPHVLSMDISVNMAIHNNTQTLAALVLENKITNYDHGEHGPSVKRKPGKPASNKEQQLWIEVAELYKATRDSETVSGIFAEKLNSDSTLVDAIDLERNGRFQEAQRIYLQIINRGQQLEMDYCFQALFNSYMEMGMWNESVEHVTAQMGDWEALWTDDWNNEHLLPIMMHSQLKLMLDNQTAVPTQFLVILDKWLLDKDRNQVLKSEYSEELIVFNMIARNHLAARVITEESILSFANDWGHLSVLSENIRRQRLQDIRIIAEIDVYLDILNKFSAEEPNEKFKTMLTHFPVRWSNSQPQKTDSLLMWDFLFSCRRFIGTLLYSSDYAPVQKASNNMYETIFNLAAAQKNFIFADKMSTILGTADRSELEILTLNCSMAQLKAEQKGFGKKSVQLAVEVLTKLQKVGHKLLLQNKDSYFHHVLQVISLLERATGVLETAQGMFSQKPELQSLIPSNLERDTHEYIMTMLQESIQVSVEFSDKFPMLRQMNELRDIHVKLAQYCLNYLDRMPQTDMEDLDDRVEREQLQKTVITSLFNSLRYESEEGQKLFPSILGLKKKDHLKTTFIEKCREVPVAMFLKWIPQLLSNLNFVKANYLDDLILRIGQEFPKALYFPFQLSYEQFQFQNPTNNDRPTIAAIKSAIYDPKLEQLVRGLSTVCLPQVMFTAHVTNLLRMLKIKQGRDLKEFLIRTIDILFPTEGLMRGRRFRAYNGIKKKLMDLLDYIGE